MKYFLILFLFISLNTQAQLRYFVGKKAKVVNNELIENGQVVLKMPMQVWQVGDITYKSFWTKLYDSPAIKLEKHDSKDSKGYEILFYVRNKGLVRKSYVRIPQLKTKKTNK